MASSSSFVHNPKWRFDVFISFRGEDTRKGFVSHLYNSLEQNGIYTFKDEEKLERGVSVAPGLFEAIQDSKLSIVVLSKNYASSIWCLEELAKILESNRLTAQIIVPVFYDVNPSDVRNQRGSFAKDFAKHEENFKHETGKVKKWREAFHELGSISGYDSRGRDESGLIKEIIKDISYKLRCIMSSDASDLVGMGPIMEQIDNLLDIGSDVVRMLGIWGMGDIGKTTIAEAIYERNLDQFEAHYFFGNVKEKFRNGGRKLLQEELLSSMVKGGNPPLETLHRGIQAIRDRFSRKKVLVILDDVDDIEQLEALAGNRNWFGLGSRIIITTRDRHLLIQHEVATIYEAHGLECDDAMQLFSQHAFKQKQPSLELRNLSMHIVEYCKGLPLALKVLGSFMYGKNMLEWKDEIKKFQRIPYAKIQNVLALSFNGLDAIQKDLFLHIACFFNGLDKTLLTKILDACGLFPTIGIKVLVDRSLLSIIKENDIEVIRMHDLLQEMGKQIVRQESVEEPGLRSQLFDYEDVYHLFTRNTGTEKVKGISLHLKIYDSGSKEVQVSCNAFAKMGNIKLIDIRMHHAEEIICSTKECKVRLSDGLKALPLDLRYLHWHGYPLKHLPSNFRPDNLVVLEMPCGNIKQFWKGTKCLENLICINLKKCQKLTKVPNLSQAPLIEKLILEGCSNLVEVHPSIEHLSKLTDLNLKGCTKLKHFPRLNWCRGSLQLLNLSQCPKIRKFPKISGKADCMSWLNLDGTSIKELSSTIEHMQALRVLSLRRCLQLKSLPSSICKLKSLETLDLYKCSKFAIFPDIVETMTALQRLDLRKTAIVTLPSSICNLRSLKELDLYGCSEFAIFPEILDTMTALETLNLQNPVVRTLPNSNCSNLTRLHFRGTYLPFLRELKYLRLNGCNLFELPSEIGDLFKLELLFLSGNNFVSLPESIKHLLRLGRLDIDRCRRLQSLPELPPNLSRLYANNCTSLERLTTIPIPDKHMEESQHLMWSKLVNMIFTGCSKLEGRHLWEILENSALTKRYETASFQNHDSTMAFQERFSLICQGSEIPEWCDNWSIGSSVTVELPEDVLSAPRFAFIFCAVVQFEKLQDYHSFFFRLHCTCPPTIGQEPVQATGEFLFGSLENMDLQESHHVVLGYCRASGIQSIEPRNCRSSVSFLFEISEGGGSEVAMVKKFGVHVINVCSSIKPKRDI